MNTNKNARLWVWHRTALVQITLRPGQAIHFGYSEPTDEGYSYSYSRFSLEDGLVTAEHRDGGRDCDGPIDRYSAAVCRVEHLRAWTNCDGDKLPDWQDAGDWQRDHYAEAMGY